ncbi:MAG: hypothetical protein OSA93_09220 [Akkermansiaceae bacterium]|nr:hypothetical protein [Akkermansiaceae bacterium]
MPSASVLIPALKANSLRTTRSIAVAGLLTADHIDQGDFRQNRAYLMAQIMGMVGPKAGLKSFSNEVIRRLIGGMQPCFPKMGRFFGSLGTSDRDLRLSCFVQRIGQEVDNFMS